MSRSKKKSKTAPVASVSRDAIQASLRSQSLGNIDLPDDELDALTTAVSSRHDNSLRIRRDRTVSLAVPTEPVPWYPNAVWPAPIDGKVAFRPSRTIDYAAGDFYLQDAGSLLALAAVPANSGALRGKLVLDLCAAPGGKASALLEAIAAPMEDNRDSENQPRGFLLANETIGSRIAPLAYNLARTGCDQYAITKLDPETLADRLPGVFDVIVVDAPCSGQAMMARGKQSATAVAESQISTNAARQQRILAAANRLLRPGGRLVYSTCTFAVAENEEQVQFLIDEYRMQPASVPSLSDYASPLADASYRLWPHRDRCAGSFAASLCKPNPASPSESPSESPSGHHERPEQSSRENEYLENRRLDLWVRTKNASAPPPDAIEQLPFLFTSQSSWYQARDWIIDAFATDSPAWTSEDYVQGPELAHRTGTTWKPSHAAALRCPADFEVGRLQLDDGAAKLYLSGQAVPATERGWQIVEHEGRPLGWIKGDGRIGKNHLPAHARIQVSQPSTLPTP